MTARRTSVRIRGRTLRSILVTATCLAALAAGALLPAGPSAAAEWRTVVIGQSGRDADTAFADSYYASDSLRSSGLGKVTLLRDAPSGSLMEVLSGLPSGGNVLIYYAGPLGDDGRSLDMAGGRVDLADMLRRLAGRGHGQIALMVEDCTSRGPQSNGLSAGLASLDMPAGTQLQIVASAGPDGSCPEPGGRLTDRLTTAQAAQEPVPFQDLVTGLWSSARLPDGPLLFNAANRPATPSAANSPVVAVVSSNPLSPVISPVGSSPVITGTAPAAPASGDAVVIFAAQPITNRMAAVPRADGMPEPSIIVGIIAQPEAAPPEEEPAPEAPGTDIAYDDVEGRRALRQSDPALYQTLVGNGAFDPPAGQLATAIQTELTRMGCYTSTIDGIWGGGSRGAVERYFTEVPGVTAVSLEPVAELFRQIILRDDVTCPAPVAAAPAPRPASTASASPAPAPAPATGGTTGGTTGGANFNNLKLGNNFR